MNRLKKTISRKSITKSKFKDTLYCSSLRFYPSTTEIVTRENGRTNERAALLKKFFHRTETTRQKLTNEYKNKTNKNKNTYNGKKCPQSIFCGCNHIVTSAQVWSSSDQDAIALIYDTLTSSDAHFGCCYSFFVILVFAIKKRGNSKQLLLIYIGWQFYQPDSVKKKKKNGILPLFQVRLFSDDAQLNSQGVGFYCLFFFFCQKKLCRYG